MRRWNNKLYLLQKQAFMQH